MANLAMRFFERFYFWKIYSYVQTDCKLFNAIFGGDPRTDWVQNWIARLSDVISFGTELWDLQKVLLSELGCETFRSYCFRNWVAELSEVIGFGTGLRDFQMVSVSELGCGTFRWYRFRNWVAGLSEVIGFGAELRDYQKFIYRSLSSSVSVPQIQN